MHMFSQTAFPLIVAPENMEKPKETLLLASVAYLALVNNTNRD